MDVSSLKFLIPVVLSVFVFYWLKSKFRVPLLIILSLGFIATYNYYLVFYIIGYALLNYQLGLMIPGSEYKIALFRTGVIINLLQLIILKYATFAIDPFFHLFDSNFLLSRISEIIIPIGVSFFTLQGIGYLVNIKMGWEKPETSFSGFLLYIIYFPKFLSGPIERSNHFLPQFRTSQKFNEKAVTEGFRLVLLGLFKKIAIANQLSPIIHNAYLNIDSADGVYLWVVVFLQPLYLYFDFSGYTDIAIGIARAFGINLLPNFNKPFLSENITTLWRRMHMSLSFWFNDYVFKQTSFKLRRWGKYASVTAVFITFTLFGIWHGAGWNFMILGFLQALAINFEYFTKKGRTKLFSLLPLRSRAWAGRFFTYLFFSVSHIFFFAPDFETALNCFGKLSVLNFPSDMTFLSSTSILVYIFILVFMLIEILDNDYQKVFTKIKLVWADNRLRFRLARWTFYYLAVFLILIFRTGNQQFIYFQF